MEKSLQEKKLKKRKAKKIENLNYFYGLISELFIIVLLYNEGYLPVGWRYKNQLGEIDVIAKNKKFREILFVEVKYRTKEKNHLETIDNKKQQRICKSAELFLSENYPRYLNYIIRFDACFIDNEFRIKYIKNAWQAIS